MNNYAYFDGELAYWQKDEEDAAAEEGREVRPSEALWMVVYCAITHYIEANWEALAEMLEDPGVDLDKHVHDWMGAQR